jgi:hypothetical protein
VNVDFRLKIDDFKALFFNRVVVAVDEATKSRLAIAGFLLRRTAKAIIRPAKQKKVAELSSRERERYYEEVKRWKDGGRVGPRPRRSTASSRPGEPPRSQTGLLKQFLFFGWDPSTRSVVVGPARLNKPTNAPRVLEYGGIVTIRGRSVTIFPRPYMEPAYQLEKKNLVEVWRDSVRPRATAA